MTPRMGVAYDVFGNGKTALKANLGKYLEGVGIQLNYANPNPTVRLPGAGFPRTVTRTWTDANGNFTPDCDLLNPNAQDLRASGGDFCGVISNLRFGQNVFTNTFDPALLTGWGVRSSDWNLGVSVQQQLLPRASVEVAYQPALVPRLHRERQPRSREPSDYTPYSVTAPLDPRLPGGGGYTVSGLYDVIPALSGQINNLVTDSGQYRELVPVFQRRRRHVERADQGRPDVSGRHQHRPDRGRQLRGQGEPAGAERRPSAPASWAPASVTTSPYCHVAYGVLTQLRGLASYTIPKIDLQVSGVFQSKPGALLAANYAVPSRRRRAVARPPSVGQRDQRHGEPDRARHAATAIDSISSTSASPRS